MRPSTSVPHLLFPHLTIDQSALLTVVYVVVVFKSELSCPHHFCCSSFVIYLLLSLLSALSNLYLYVLCYVNCTLKSIYSKYVYDARGERTSKRVRSKIIQLIMSFLTIQEESFITRHSFPVLSRAGCRNE